MALDLDWDTVQTKLREMEASIAGAPPSRIDETKVYDKLAQMAGRLSYYEVKQDEGEFDPSKHPRAAGGRFGAGGGGAAAPAAPAAAAPAGGGGAPAAPAAPSTPAQTSSHAIDTTMSAVSATQQAGANGPPAPYLAAAQVNAASAVAHNEAAAQAVQAQLASYHAAAASAHALSAQALAAKAAAAKAKSAASAAATAAKKPRPPYVVTAHDTAASLAERFGMTPEELAKANPQVADMSKLSAGTVLMVPGTGSLSNYVTSATDSAQSISNRYEVTKDQLAKANPRISNIENIPAGTRINIPSPAKPTAAKKPAATTTKPAATTTGKALVESMLDFKAEAADDEDESPPAIHDLQNNPAVANMLAGMQQGIAGLMANAANQNAAGKAHTDLAALHDQIVQSLTQRPKPPKTPATATTKKTLVELLDVTALWDFL
jgi:LysM repeat protein